MYCEALPRTITSVYYSRTIDNEGFGLEDNPHQIATTGYALLAKKDEGRGLESENTPNQIATDLPFKATPRKDSYEGLCPPRKDI